MRPPCQLDLDLKEKIQWTHVGVSVPSPLPLFYSLSFRHHEYLNNNASGLTVGMQRVPRYRGDGGRERSGPQPV